MSYIKKHFSSHLITTLMVALIGIGITSKNPIDQAIFASIIGLIVGNITTYLFNTTFNK